MWIRPWCAAVWLTYICLTLSKQTKLPPHLWIVVQRKALIQLCQQQQQRKNPSAAPQCCSIFITSKPIIIFCSPVGPSGRPSEESSTLLSRGSRWPLYDFNPTLDCFLLCASSRGDTGLHCEPPAGVKPSALSWIILHVGSEEESDS